MRTADFQNVLVRGVERRMKFEERVGRGAVIRPLQRFKYLFTFVFIRGFASEPLYFRRKRRKAYRDDIGITHDGVGEREREDDLELERRHVAVYGDVLQCI